MGYSLAGFDVVGVDINPQPHYPFEFYQADAMEYPLDGFDVIHASPPCTGFSVASIVHRNNGKKYIDLLTPIREKLRENGKPFIIENVPGAPIHPMVTLCGLMFGLKVFRHRHFESSELIMKPEHPSHSGKKIGEGFFSVAGGAGRWKSWGTVKRNVSKGTVAQWKDAMGINWMTRNEIKLAIPPAYTEWIGKQLMELIGAQDKDGKTEQQITTVL
jgi:DNA (cytosine-5)-methyltransferase 1